MRSKATTGDAVEPNSGGANAAGGWTGKREFQRDSALRSAMDKRTAGVPTYSVPEAAALLSISQEYLYRLIQAGGFPAVRLRMAGGHGRYVVPAESVEQLLRETAAGGSSVELSDWVVTRSAQADGGVA